MHGAYEDINWYAKAQFGGKEEEYGQTFGKEFKVILFAVCEDGDEVGLPFQENLCQKKNDCDVSVQEGDQYVWEGVFSFIQFFQASDKCID